MALTQKNQLLIAAKKLAGKAHTNSRAGIANESVGTSIQIDSAIIFADTIPASPNETLYESTDNIVQKVEFTLEPITLSKYASDTTATKTSIEADGDISDNTKFHAYALKLSTGYEAASVGKNPKVGTFPFTNGTSLTGSAGSLQIVPTKFGTSYYPVAYSNNDVIGSFDEEDYYLDSYSGILFVQDQGLSLRIPDKVEAYIYIGNFLGGPTGVTSAGGANYAIQFNSGSLMSGSENLTYNYDTNVFRIQGTQGELFTVNNNLREGTIFSVNDISGIPSIEVDADGTVSLAELGGNVGIGTSNPNYKLEVVGTISASAINLANYDSVFKPTSNDDRTVWRNNPGNVPYWSFITEDMIVKLVSISSFSIVGPSQREVGVGVTNPTFNTVVANESNVSATIQNNKDSIITSFVYSGTTATGVGSLHSYGAGNTGITDSWTFTLTVTSNTSPTYTKTATTSFLWGRYMYWGTNTTGISTNAELTENFVKTLDDPTRNGSKTLVGSNILGVTSNSKTFNDVPVASYAYAAYPNALLTSPTGIRIGSFDYKIANGDCIDLGTISVSRDHDSSDPILYRVLRVTSNFTADSNNPQVMTVISS